jgi:hypothetical protein
MNGTDLMALLGIEIHYLFVAAAMLNATKALSIPSFINGEPFYTTID